MRKKIPTKIKKGFYWTGLGLVCFSIGFWSMHYVLNRFPDTSIFLNLLRWLEGALLLVLSYGLQIVFHELGHMLAAMTRGWKFVSFMAFGLLISKEKGRLHLSRFSLPGAAGQSLMMPPENWDTLGGLLFYNAGGLLMNALVMLVSLVLLIWGPSSMLYEIQVLLLGFVLSGLFILATNGIPQKKRGIPNDATNMVVLKEDPFSVIAFQKLLRYNALMSQGMSLGEINPDYLFAEHEPDLGNTVHVSLLSFDLSLAMSRMDFDKAREIVRTVRLQAYKLFSMFRNEFKFEEIYLDLVVGEAYPTYIVGTAMLKYMDKNAKTRPIALRAKYAIAKFRDHDEALAEGIYQKFNALCDNYSPSGEVDAERRLMEYARNKPIFEEESTDCL